MNVENISPMQWLAIDVANQYGNDKVSFSERIQWVKDNLDNLESLKPKKKFNYLSAVKALRQAMKGEPVSRLIGLDSSQSGIQIMSVLMRDQEGCKVTNAIPSDRIHDAYTEVTERFNKISGLQYSIERSIMKAVVMPTFYGSWKKPEEIFGKSKELNWYFQAIENIAPLAWQLRNALVKAWNPTVSEYHWVMPDGFNVKIPVLVQKKLELTDSRLETKLTMISYFKEPKEKGVSLSANLIHSVDAYVLRTMVRRLCYDKEVLSKVTELLIGARIASEMGVTPKANVTVSPLFLRLKNLHEQTKMPDTRIFTELTRENVRLLSSTHIDALFEIASRMSKHEPIEMYTVHDDFRVHPNHAYRVIDEYRNILAELSDSDTLNFLLNQLGLTYTSNAPKIGYLIKQSQYALA